MTETDPAKYLLRHGHIGEIDRLLAEMVAELDGGAGTEVALAAVLASASTQSGHVCATLAEIAGQAWPADAADGGLQLPDLAPWLERLHSSPAVMSAADAPPAPLVLDRAGRLYLNRMWRREQQVARGLKELASAVFAAPEAMERVLDELFGEDDRNKKPRQAALAAVTGRLCCVSGGPGTGKTTTVAKIMLALLGLGLVESDQIALTAPTGKAAARLQEAANTSLRRAHAAAARPSGGTMDPIGGAIHSASGAAQSHEEANHPESRHSPAQEQIEVEVSTVHGWLRKTEVERARAKVLIVDEVSMVDINLMCEVLQALPKNSRLILLGDAGQLASVQPGAVFADICAAAGHAASALRGRVVNLTHNWRFSETGGIGRLAREIRRGDADAALAALEDDAETAIDLRPLEDSTAFEKLADSLTEEHYAPMVERIREAKSFAEIKIAGNPFTRFMALCAHRRGRSGSGAFNQLVERRLRALGLIPTRTEFYLGRPIIVTRNDRRLDLANGDTGIMVAGENGKPTVWFPELSAEGGEPKIVTPLRLPPHESFYALTVHRSQGSEYDEVAVMPGPAESPVNTRELLYTAVTRARNKVVIHGARDGIKSASERETARGSGLKDALR